MRHNRIRTVFSALALTATAIALAVAPAAADGAPTYKVKAGDKLATIAKRASKTIWLPNGRRSAPSTASNSTSGARRWATRFPRPSRRTTASSFSAVR